MVGALRTTGGGDEVFRIWVSYQYSGSIVGLSTHSFGFFDQNPSIDVAPSEKAGTEDHCHTGTTHDYQRHLHH